MNTEQLGAGYFRFNLPEEPDKAEVDRIDEIFRRTRESQIDKTNVKECFVPSKPFWDLYKDCLAKYLNTGTATRPVIFCTGDDAEFLQTMLGVFRKAAKEMQAPPASEHPDPSLPALVNAHLRAIIPQEQLGAEPRYQKAQNKDIGRKLVTG
jgi:hypothetical protein